MNVRRKFAKALRGTDLDADIAALDDQKLFSIYERRCDKAHKRGKAAPDFTDGLYAAYQRAIHRPYWCSKIPFVVSNAFYSRLEKDSVREGTADNCQRVFLTISGGDSITSYARTP